MNPDRVITGDFIEIQGAFYGQLVESEKWYAIQTSHIEDIVHDVAIIIAAEHPQHMDGQMLLAITPNLVGWILYVNTR